MQISDIIKTVPFDDMSEIQYIGINDIVDKPFDLTDVLPFENDKGPGVNLRIIIDGQERYTVTHSVVIVSKVTSDAVRDVLDNESISCKIVKRKSAKSDRTVFDII